MNYYYKIGGCLNPNHPTYVTRKADRELFDYLQKREYCLILNSRQMGKSSLRVKTAKKLRQKGVKCASIDLTLIGSYNTSDKWYKGFADLLLNSLEIDTEINLNQHWYQPENLPENSRLGKLLELILNNIQKNIVIFIDEIDSIIKTNFKDDFLAFIRACYNQRAEKPEFHRLTFCLIGVASPRDLIEDKTKTSFNIGYSIELTGLTFSESKSAFLQGLMPYFSEAEAILQEILTWTGGQPFLTQKLCQLVVEKAETQSYQNVEQIVQEFIIKNWENQDQPEHLRTIRDRFLNDDNQLIILGELYRKILLNKSVIFNNSPEQIILRLTGLVTLKNNYLKIYNPIYQSVFNLDWLNYHLKNKRPYSNYLNSWLQSNKDKSFLLQGKFLAESQQWAEGKLLSNLDYEFLATSQAEQDKKENEILAKANQKAQKIIKLTIITSLLILSGVLSGTFFYSKNQINNARQIIQLEKLGNDIQQNFENNQIKSLIKAIQAGNSLKKLVNKNQSISDYPTLSPVTALLNILSKIQLKNEVKLQNYHGEINTVTISPDNSIIASGNKEGIVELWHPDGTLIKTPNPLKYQGEIQLNPAIFAVKFSPDSQMIAAINYDGIVSIWQKNGTLISRFKTVNQDYRVYHIEFSHDGKLLASGSTDGKIKIWSIKGELLQTLQAKNNEKSTRINSLSFSPDNKLIAVGSEDGNIRIWELNGKFKTLFNAHKRGVNNLIFTPNGKQIVSGGSDGLIKLWSLNGKLNNTLNLSDSNNNLRISQPISLLKISDDGKILASTDNQGDIKVWTLDEANFPQILLGNNARISSLNFNDNGKTLISAHKNGQIRSWQINDSISPKNPITSINYNQEDNQLIIGKLDGTIEIKTKDNKLNKQIKSDSEIKGIFKSLDEQNFYTARWDGLIQLWQHDGKLIKNVIDYRGNIENIVFNPINKTMAIINDENSVQLYNLEGKFLKNLLENQKVTRLAFHPKGKILAFVTTDKGINLFWQNEGKQISLIEASKNPITDIKFSPDGKLLATGDTGGIINIWRSNGELLFTLTNKNKSITNISFNSDSKILAVANDDGNISFLPLTIDDLISQGCQWLQDYLQLQTHQQVYPSKINNLCRVFF